MKNPVSKKIVIIGGGITGLAAAHKLTEIENDNICPEVILIESKNRLGGIIETKYHNDCILELGPDAFITQKPWALALCRRLGFEDKLINTNSERRKTLIVKNGELVPLPEGFYLLAPGKIPPLFESNILSREGKLRMAIEYFLPPKTTDTDETLAQFVRRRFGEEALTRIAQPMVGGIYGGDPEKLSLKAIMPRFLEMEKEEGSVIKALLKQKSTGDTGARYSMFVTPEKGFQSLLDELEKQVEKKTKILKNTCVKKIEKGYSQSLYSVITSNATIETDSIILAIPSFAASALLIDIDSELSQLTGTIEFSSSAIINFLFDSSKLPEDLDGFGFVVPYIEKLTMMACTFTSIKFPNRTKEKYFAMRAFLGGLLQEDVLKDDDQTLISKVLEELQTLLKTRATPLFSELTRYPHSMPQYNTGHLELVDKIESLEKANPGLALCGNSYRGVGIPDSIKSGEEAALRILNYLYPTNRETELKARISL